MNIKFIEKIFEFFTVLEEFIEIVDQSWEVIDLEVKLKGLEEHELKGQNVSDIIFEHF